MHQIYNPEHINYALVEGIRPPMYCAMKYWGRKPHNIWSDYIKHYCPKDGIVLDPFVGSGITAFESLKLGRKVVTTDINPLSSFVIETMTSRFEEDAFKDAVNRVTNHVLNNEVYKKHFIREFDGEICTVYNYIWEKGLVSKVRMKNESETKSYSIDSTDYDIKLADSMVQLEIPFWYPQDTFPKNPSINQNFVSKIGGTTFDNLWTRRNLYILSLLFDRILKEDKSVISHLLYAFIHTLHLVSKMVVPRSEKGNRDFSGSWGRADYMIRNRSMEQNPLIVFLRSCYEKQGVLKAMCDANNQLPKKAKLNNINKKGRINLNSDLNYGIVDIADLNDYLADNSVDFILTDPPYGGLVQYMDLSMIWLVWLKKYDLRFSPNSDGEITYKKGITSRTAYKRKLIRAFQNMYRVLKPDHYIVITFHNQDIKEWNDFVSAIRQAGFTFEKVTHQYNKRSGESNVSNPYGTTGSDFYIRCKKQQMNCGSNSTIELQNYVIDKVRQILIERAEPTPFSFIINGLLPDMLQAGYLKFDEPSEELSKLLSHEIGNDKIFKVTEGAKNSSGDIFWFNHPELFISHRNISLTERVDMTVKALLRRMVSVKYDDIVAEIFKEFPNGLTPDPQGIVNVVEKYAIKANGKWKLKDDVERDCTEHTFIISILCSLARKARNKSFVGKREQREILDNGKKLSELADHTSLNEILSDYNDNQIERIEMIDVVWIDDNSINVVFEVENSTDFIGAVSRSSNISATLPKYMIIPERRINEFLNYRDALFVEGFRNNNWRYILYDDLIRLNTLRTIKLEQINQIAKTI